MLTKLVIDRSKWLWNPGAPTDGKQGGSALLQPKEWVNTAGLTPRMCCLGFVGKALGISDDNLRGFGYPRARDGDNQLICGWEEPFIEEMGVSPFSNNAACINDDSSLPREEKEVKLIELFKIIGIELTFEGEP